LKYLEENLPDLMLLDINMPEMNGYEVIKVVKDIKETKDIPIVLLTGIEIDGGRVKALSIGATEYFNKSVEHQKLFEAVERIIDSNSNEAGKKANCAVNTASIIIK
jgi:CheY-like chemotaxis protein